MVNLCVCSLSICCSATVTCEMSTAYKLYSLLDAGDVTPPVNQSALPIKPNNSLKFKAYRRKNVLQEFKRLRHYFILLYNYNSCFPV